jgi:hypothetical protein
MVVSDMAPFTHFKAGVNKVTPTLAQEWTQGLWVAVVACQRTRAQVNYEHSLSGSCQQNPGHPLKP